MSLRRFIKKSELATRLYFLYLATRTNFRNLGIFPLSFRRLTKIPRYLKERKKFIKSGGKITRTLAIVDDYNDSAGTTKGHYFHQDLLVAQFIHEHNPAKHVDVGSRIDGFVAHVASFREIEVLDIRDLVSDEHPNIKYTRSDLMNDCLSEVTDSLSCLHTIEHFGLGRYGDPINANGYVSGLRNLVAMLKPFGKLYLSFPIGDTNEVQFNAHRIFHPQDIFTWSPKSLKLLRFDFVDDNGALHKDVDIHEIATNFKYGCGIYTFEKVF